MKFDLLDLDHICTVILIFIHSMLDSPEHDVTEFLLFSRQCCSITNVG